MASTLHNDLFSSLISGIKSYSGNDPLLPWLGGVRKMRDTLPLQLLNEKLPRFLQKCAQTFESDRRYRNDLRFIRIWLQLMDYVDDPRALLRTMEVKKIGIKRSLFYRAYALYYEKMKKFEEAEKMYRLGVQNLAEPLDELHKSYEQFLRRMERQKTKRIQGRNSRRPLSDMGVTLESSTLRDNAESSCKDEGSMKVCPTESSAKAHSNEVKHDLGNMPIQSYRSDMSSNDRDSSTAVGNSSEKGIPSYVSMKEVKELASSGCLAKHQGGSDKSNEASTLHRDDSVVIKFVDTAMIGRSEAEDAIHHGLVDPTINMKEAMDAINNMFREPLEPAVNRRSRRSQQQLDQNLCCGLEVFVDENLDDQVRPSKDKNELGFPATNDQMKIHQSVQEPLKIFIDEEGDDVNEKCIGKDNSGSSEVNTSVGDSPSSSLHPDAFVFLRPNDNCSESTNDLRKEKSSKRTFREDTVVCRFVGAAISDEPEVENMCHHGLVDPTINLKEAMDDINNMFGEPIDFVRATRKKRQEKAATSKNNFNGFSILADDDLVSCKDQQHLLRSSRKGDDSDLFEQTVCTKEAIDDINKMFSIPLDF